MNKKDIYECLINKIPLERSTNDCFIDFVKNIFDDFLKLIENAFANDTRLDLVKDFIIKSQKSLVCYNKDNIESSKEIFMEAIKPLIGDNDYNYNGILPIYNKNYNDIYVHNNGSFIELYRVVEYEESMWHIPFEKKHLSSSGRFSVPCLPCSYLSNSIQTCLNELGNPLHKNFFVSYFGLDYNQIIVLDLTMPQIVTDESEDDFYDKAILSWPLVALCMIKRPRDKSPFYMEYLFSQYIIEMLSDEKRTKVRAVKYFSTKCNNLKSFNIAIPTRVYAKAGYCTDVKNIFKEDDRWYSQYNKYIVSKPKKMGDMDIDILQEKISDNNYPIIK